MGDIKYIRILASTGFPTTIDLTGSGNVLNVDGLKVTGATASKPVKFNADKKLVGEAIDLAADVTGSLPYANMNIGDGDLTIAKTDGLQDALDDKIDSSEKGANSGVATLDAGGKVPVAQLPNSIMDYRGTWNPSTNTPVLSDTAIKASKIIQDLTYSAKTAGAPGNLITITYTDTVTQGNEVASRVGNAYSVAIEDGVSTATQIKAAVDALNELVDVTISGTGGDAQDVVSAIALENGQDVASAGDVYVCSAAGTINLGSGNITFAAGDWCIFNGTTWEKSINSNAVASVNGQTGAVDLDTDDIDEGTNKYFSDALAQAAVVASSIVEDDTTHAPSGGAVFDALAAKADDSVVVKSVNGVSPTAGAVELDTDDVDEGVTNKYFSNDLAKAAAVVNSTAGDETDQAPSVSAMKSYVSSAVPPRVEIAAIAGETFAANKTFAVRYAVNGETAGRVYKASKLVPTDNKYWVEGVIQTTAEVAAGGAVTLILLGEVTLKSGDTAFAASSENKAVFLQDAGAFSVISPASGLSEGTVFASAVIGNVKIQSSTVTNNIFMVRPLNYFGDGIA
jgi:hypothetical protein